MQLASSHQIAKKLNLAHSTIRGYISKLSIRPQKIQRVKIFTAGSRYQNYTRVNLYDIDSVLASLKK